MKAVHLMCGKFVFRGSQFSTACGRPTSIPTVFDKDKVTCKACLKRITLTPAAKDGKNG